MALSLSYTVHAIHAQHSPHPPGTEPDAPLPVTHHTLLLARVGAGQGPAFLTIANVPADEAAAFTLDGAVSVVIAPTAAEEIA